MSIYKSSSLAMIPTAYKDGKLYSVRPTDGSGDFTFSRGSNLAATRVDVNGLIEKGRENVLLQSNQFNTTWSTPSSSVTGGQSGYDGSNDAWELTATNTSNAYVNQSLSFNSVQTLSVYAKANTADFIELVTIGGGGANPRSWFNLATGSVGTSYNCIDTKIEAVSGGWYRCSITLNASITGYRIYVMDGDNSTAVTNGNSIYIQDAQLEQGLVATDYIETGASTAQAGILEDMPRLDYSGGATCPSLLLEPSRSNLITQSEYFDSWNKGNATISANATTSPEGVSNAAKLIGSSGVNDKFIRQFITYTSGSHSFSVYAKQDEANWLQFIIYDGSNHFGYFNLATGALGNQDAGFTSTMTDVGNGWYKIEVVFTTAAFSGQWKVMLSDGNGSVNFTGNGSDGLYIYGAQAEAGSYPTSYIPAYGSSVTRSQDVCNKTGATSLIGQSEGTLFLDFVANDEDSLQIIYQVRTTGSTNTGQIDFRIQSGNLRALGNDGGTGQFNISAGAAVAGTRYKCAVRYANNNVAFYVNGVLKGTDTSASFSSSSLDQITFNENGTTFYPSVNVNQALLFKTGLTDTELASLTTL